MTFIQRRLGRVPRELLVAVAVIVVGLLVAGSVSEFRAQQWTQWVIYGLLVLSFSFIWGHGGIFSFGQAALFGIGGYTYGVVAINLIDVTGETVSAVLAAAAMGAMASGLLGYFMFYGNVGDVYVAIITLAASLVLLTVMSSTAGPEYHIGDAQLGGYNGMVGVPQLSYGTPGGVATPLSISQMLMVFVVIAVLVTLALYILMRRPFGRVVAALRENELRTQLLGYDVRRYKLATFMIGGAIAGLAGAGYAAWGTFINPSVFGLQQAALVAIWVLVGGRTSFVGAFVGVLLIEQLSSSLGGSGSTATPIALGAVLIAVVLLLPRGVVPWLRDVVWRLVPALRPRPRLLPEPSGRRLLASGVRDGDGARDNGEARLAADLLIKRFGGVTAVNGVSVAFQRRGIHCLIGPNGAGKSTFFNLLVGRYRPSSGRVLLDGADITKRRPDERAQQGMGIKLQVPSLYLAGTAFDNLWLAAYASSRHVHTADERAASVLDWIGLRDRGNMLAAVLSHGEQQWLEIGMVVASEPEVVLLDEPTAGMTREETARTAELVRSLAQRACVIVVEHDMDFVRMLDAPITMFHEGSVFASGTLADLRRDERVLDVYLGRAAHAEAG